jgi:hypothetical protein
MTDDELRQQLYDAEQEIQDLIRDCMVSDGFDYVSADARVTLSLSPKLVYDAPVGTADWIASYGLGMTTLAFDQSLLPNDLRGAVQEVEGTGDLLDPNSDTYEALTADEKAAWDQALNDCTGSIRLSTFEKRQAQVSPESERQAAAQIAALGDSRTIRIRQLLADCVRHSGFELPSEMSPEEFLFQRFYQLLNLADLDVGPLDDQQLKELGAAQEYERRFAAALSDCGYFGDVQRQLQAILDEYEQGNR